MIFAGLEGGSSNSNVSLMDGNGKLLASVGGGPATNHLLIGSEECQRRIVELVGQAKRAANLEDDLTLSGLGLCMSGCEDEQLNLEFAQSMLTAYPKLARSIVVKSDTVGSISTACPEGCMVLISGTGSNCLLQNPDGSTFSCGGWGHLYSDKGSGCWIVLKAIEIVSEHDTNFCPCEYPVENVRSIIFNHFGVKSYAALLKPVCADFEKSHFAGVCSTLANAATQGDKLARSLFHEAGIILARHVKALIPKVHPDLTTNGNNLIVVCVGSLFKSWPLLEKGFNEIASTLPIPLDLVRLTCPSSIGAAFIAAKKVNYSLPIDFASNIELISRINSVPNESQTITQSDRHQQ